MANDFSGNKRTLRAYISDLLEYPRWVISRDVDFSHCQYGGHHNEFLAECVDCQFGQGCRWLDRHRSPGIDAAPLNELIQALDSAVMYLQSTHRNERSNDAEMRAWIRQARQFLRTHHEESTSTE